jgi:ribosome maturation factor RimP
MCPPFNLYTFVNMAVFKTQTESRVFDIINKSLDVMGYEIVRIRTNPTPKNKTLQIMLDRKDGNEINIGDCEKASKEVSTLLYVEDFAVDDYNLEVSSPGLDRPLTRVKDFTNSIGKFAKLTAGVPVEGRRKFYGRIEAVEENDIIVIDIKDEDMILKINFEDISEAKLDYFNH